jgi:hypothetical protein
MQIMTTGRQCKKEYVKGEIDEVRGKVLVLAIYALV